MIQIKKMYNIIQQYRKNPKWVTIKMMKLTTIVLVVSILSIRMVHGLFIYLISDYNSFVIEKLNYKAEFGDEVYVKAGFQFGKTPIDMKFSGGSVKFVDELTNGIIMKLKFEGGRISKSSLIIFEGKMKVKRLDNNLAIDIFLNRKKHKKVKVLCKFKLEPRILLIRFGFTKHFMHNIVLANEKKPKLPKILSINLDENQEKNTMSLSSSISIKHIKLHDFIDVELPRMVIELKCPSGFFKLEPITIKNGVCEDPINLCIQNDRTNNEGFKAWVSQFLGNFEIKINLKGRIEEARNESLIDMMLENLVFNFQQETPHAATGGSTKFIVSINSITNNALDFIIKYSEKAWEKTFGPGTFPIKIPHIDSSITIDNAFVGLIRVRTIKSKHSEFHCSLQIEDINKVMSFFINKNMKCTILVDEKHYLREFFGFNKITFDMKGNIQFNDDNVMLYNRNATNNLTSTVKQITHRIDFAKNGFELCSATNFGKCDELIPQFIVEFDSVLFCLETSKMLIKLDFYPGAHLKICDNSETVIDKLFGDLIFRTSVTFKDAYFNQDFESIKTSFTKNMTEDNVVFDRNTCRSRIYKILQSVTDDGIIVINQNFKVDTLDLLKEYERNVQNGDSLKKRILSVFKLVVPKLTPHKLGFKFIGEQYDDKKRRFCIKNVIWLSSSMVARIKYISTCFKIAFKAPQFTFYVTEKGFEGFKCNGYGNNIELSLLDIANPVKVADIIHAIKCFEPKFLSYAFVKGEIVFKLLLCINKFAPGKTAVPKDEIDKGEVLGNTETKVTYKGDTTFHNIHLTHTQSIDIMNVYNNFGERFCLEIPDFMFKFVDQHDGTSIFECKKIVVKYNPSKGTFMFSDISIDMSIHKGHHSLGQISIYNHTDNTKLFTLNLKDICKHRSSTPSTEKPDLIYNILSVSVAKTAEIAGDGAWIDARKKNPSEFLQDIYKNLKIQVIPKTQDFNITVDNLHVLNCYFNEQTCLTLALKHINANFVVNYGDKEFKVNYNKTMSIKKEILSDKKIRKILEFNPFFNLFCEKPGKEKLFSTTPDFLSDKILYSYLKSAFNLSTNSTDKYYIVFTDNETLDFSTAVYGQKQIYKDRHSLYSYINYKSTMDGVKNSFFGRLVNIASLGLYDDKVFGEKTFDIYLVKNSEIVLKINVGKITMLSWACEKIAAMILTNFQNGSEILKWSQKKMIDSFYKFMDAAILAEVKSHHYKDIAEIVNACRKLVDMCNNRSSIREDL